LLLLLGNHEVWFGFKRKTNPHKSQLSKSKPTFKAQTQAHGAASLSMLPSRTLKQGDFLGAKAEKRGGHSISD